MKSKPKRQEKAHETEVAMAAPLIPSPKTYKKTGSKMMFRMAEDKDETIDWMDFPWAIRNC